MCSREGLLDFENEEYVVSLSSIWAGLSSSLLLPPDKGQTLAAQPGARLSPASGLGSEDGESRKPLLSRQCEVQGGGGGAARR